MGALSQSVRVTDRYGSGCFWGDNQLCGQDLLGGPIFLLPIPELSSEEEGYLSWVPTASSASGKPTRVTEGEGSGLEDQCLSFPPNTDLGVARPCTFF